MGLKWIEAHDGNAETSRMLQTIEIILSQWLMACSQELRKEVVQDAGSFKQMFLSFLDAIFRSRKKSAEWNICLSGIQNFISLYNFNSDKMQREDEKRRTSFCDWIEFYMQFFSPYIRAVLLLDKVLIEIRGLDSLFRNLHATSLTKNRKKYDWKLLKSSHQEKVNSFLMMSLIFSPLDFCCQALFYGIMCYFGKSLHCKICNSALLNV